MTEELGGSELPTGGTASLFKVKHCGTKFPYDLCVALLCHRKAGMSMWTVVVPTIQRVWSFEA